MVVFIKKPSVIKGVEGRAYFTYFAVTIDGNEVKWFKTAPYTKSAENKLTLRRIVEQALKAYRVVDDNGVAADGSGRPPIYITPNSMQM